VIHYISCDTLHYCDRFDTLHYCDKLLRTPLLKAHLTFNRYH